MPKLPIFTKVKKFKISIWFSKRNMYRAAFQTLSRQSCRHLGSNIRLLRNVTPQLLQPTKFNLKQSNFCSTVTNQNDEQNITGHSTLFDYLPNISQILCEFNGNSVVGLIFNFFSTQHFDEFLVTVWGFCHIKKQIVSQKFRENIGDDFSWKRKQILIGPKQVFFLSLPVEKEIITNIR